MSTLDLTTLTCPWTIIKTKQAMDKLSNGENLLITVTDPSFIIDCQVYAKQTGHKLLYKWHKGDNICCLLQKN
jgi:tRNA 2-thiouridine synthesizing protein A